MAQVTAKRISPAKADLSSATGGTPKQMFLENTQIVQTKAYNGTKGGGATVQYGTAGRPFQKKIKVYETPAQMEVAKDQTSATGQDKQLATTALGSTQGAGYPIVRYLTECTVTNPGTADGYLLPASAPNMVRVVMNNGIGGTGVIKVYPATGESIVNAAGTNLGANAPISMNPATRLHFVCDVAGTWKVAVVGQ